MPKRPLDDIDRKILVELQADGRMSLNDLAAKVEVTKSSLDRMPDSGEWATCADGNGQDTPTPTPTPPNNSATPVPTPPPPPPTYAETVGGNANTWSNYGNAGGTHGPTIPAYTTVQVACKVSGFRVADGNTWWYRIASAPWASAYYVSADSFYNNGQTSGTLHGTPFVDNNVPNC